MPATHTTVPSERTERLSGARELAAFVGVLGAIAAVHFFRDSASFLLPPLSYEDGRDFFAFFYNHRDPDSILRFYAGYVSLVPNLVGYLAMGLPTSWAPRALAWIPGLFAALACALPFWTFRSWMTSPLWRAGTCFTLALLPVGNRLFLSSTAYSLWTLLLILVWLSLTRPPATWRGALLRGSVMAALICSHPLSLALAPVYAYQLGAEGWRGVRTKGPEGPTGVRWLRVLFPSVLLVVLGLYGAFGIAPGGLESPAPLSALGLTVQLLLERVVFGTVFGDAVLLTLRGAGAVAWIYGGALGILAVTAWLTLRYLGHLRDSKDDDPRGAQEGVGRQATGEPLVTLAWLAWLVIAFTGLYVISRAPTAEILEGGAAMRYFWVQRLLFAAGLVLLVHSAYTARPLPGLRGIPRPLALWGLFLALALLNLANAGSYRSPRRLGHQMAGFVQQVVAKEAAAGGRVTATLPRSGPWSVELRPRTDPPEPGPRPHPMP